VTNFTKRNVDEIVAAAVRHGYDGKINQLPSLLSGMETNLRDVLEWAEKQHDEACGIAKRDAALFERLKATRQQRSSFMGHIGAAVADWQNMTDQDKFDLVWAGEPMVGPFPEWADRPTDHIRGMVQSFEAALAVFQKATAVHTIVRGKGRRHFISDASDLSSLPLEVFVTILREFWEASVGSPFGQEFSDDKTPPVALSAPANFVVKAVSYLSAKYSTTQIRTVMRKLQKKVPPNNPCKHS
jgi:hypothetical protein